MSTGPSRFIFVDDTSPLISYQGSWKPNSDTYSATIQTTQMGRPFNDTLHWLQGDIAGNFTFNFTGSSVSVIGTIMGSTLPSWTCFVDGFALISNNISLVTVNQNNVEFCSLQNITTTNNTPSNLKVVASADVNGPFLLDYVQYAPDASTILDNATVVVGALDDQIHYNSGWSPINKSEMYSGMGNTSMEATVPGASMTFDFVGIRIAWITSIALKQGSSSPYANSRAQYSIDNGTLFPIQVIGQNSTIQSENLVSFRTPNLSPGPHRLFVQYEGANDSVAPLLLDHLVIQNLTIQTFPSFGHARLSNGAIAGIVGGSLVGLAIILTIAILAFKRKSAPTSQRPESRSFPYSDGHWQPGSGLPNSVN